MSLEHVSIKISEEEAVQMVQPIKFLKTRCIIKERERVYMESEFEHSYQIVSSNVIND